MPWKGLLPPNNPERPPTPSLPTDQTSTLPPSPVSPRNEITESHGKYVTSAVRSGSKSTAPFASSTGFRSALSEFHSLDGKLVRIRLRRFASKGILTDKTCD